VCPLSLVIAQQDAVPAPVVAAVRALHARILGFYVESLAEARERGQACFTGSAADEGALVAGALIGAQLLARIQGPEAYERVLRQQARALALPDPFPSASEAPRSPA
jgi:hypothetical protein